MKLHAVYYALHFQLLQKIQTRLIGTENLVIKTLCGFCLRLFGMLEALYFS